VYDTGPVKVAFFPAQVSQFAPIRQWFLLRRMTGDGLKSWLGQNHFDLKK